jgi:hypothetical protein
MLSVTIYFKGVYRNARIKLYGTGICHIQRQANQAISHSDRFVKQSLSLITPELLFVWQSHHFV